MEIFLVTLDEERKGIKRKKIQSALFEKDVEPVAKRRSARVSQGQNKLCVESFCLLFVIEA